MQTVRRIFRWLACFFAVWLWPLVAIALFADGRSSADDFITLPWGATLLLVLLVFFPPYAGTVCLMTTLHRMSDGKPRARADRRANAVEAILMATAVVSWTIGAALGFEGPVSLVVSWIAAGAAILVGVSCAVAFRRGVPADSPLRRPSFYVISVLVLSAVFFYAVWRTGAGSPNLPDPLAPAVNSNWFLKIT